MASPLKKLLAALPEQGERMPVVFIGHGSPMNGIENNEFSREWQRLGRAVPRPRLVLVVSAHWYTKGTLVTAMDAPRTIHDFGGFPQALFDVQYPAKGDPAAARDVKSVVNSTNVELDHEWGLDHGTWTVVKHMYPGADIPVLQLSIDYSKPPRFHYELAKELQALRNKGVLIIGSGNMVHNLRLIKMDPERGFDHGFDWAWQMNDVFKKHIGSGDFEMLINYQKLGKEGQLAIPTPEHYLPLIYTLGLKDDKDQTQFFNDKAVGGSLTMTSVRFG